MAAHASSSQTPPCRIFLSHAGEDKETVARPLFKRLREHGVTVFLDEESFGVGDHCPEVMIRAMETAPVGVFIMSPEFVAKEWPMRELLTFVRRYDCAKESEETPPLIIPIFYRFFTHECRDPAIFNTYHALFHQHGLYRRACDGTVPLEHVMHALDTAAKMWSIRNDVGASNSDKPGMSRTRKALIDTIETLILNKLGVESGASCRDVPPTKPIQSCQSSQQDEYTSRNVVPSNPPRLTLNYDTLTTCEGRLKAAVLRRSESRVVAVLASGKGGVGKTCAMRGLAGELEMNREFSGGILYVELGNDATIRNVIEGIAHIVACTGGVKLAKLIATVKTVREASQKASQWFGERRCLFLVDDIWHVNGIDSDTLEDMERMVGAKGRMVYTTRDRYFVHDATEWIEFKEKEAHGELSRQMLIAHAGFDPDMELGDKNQEALKYFLGLCQGLPLGFGIIGRSVREYSWDCTPRENGWSEFHGAVLSLEEDWMKTKAKSYGTMPKIVESSLLVLEKRSGHGKHGYWFRALSAVQKQQSVPAEMLQKLWSMESLKETKSVVKSFADVSVVDMIRKRGSVSLKLHDLVLDVATHYATEKNETKSFYQTLLQNYIKCGEGKQRDELQAGATTSADCKLCCSWWKVQDDGYIRNNVCRLLRKAGYVEQLLWLLSQPEWIVSRLVEGGILSLEQDLEHGRAVCNGSASQHADRKEHLQMIGRAGRMSASFVHKNGRTEEGWFQIHGRLQWHATQNELTNKFVERMEECAPRPWLKASGSLLQQAGSNGAQVVPVSGAVLCTHEERDAIWMLSHDSDTEAVHVGRYDKLNGSCTETKLEGCQWSYNDDHCASFLRDHRRVVIAHADEGIGVWSTTTGVCEEVMQHTSESNTFVNFLELGTIIAVQLADYSFELRDTLSGEFAAPPLKGHTGGVNCVAVSADGTRIVSGSDDETVRVWDAHTGSAVGQPLEGHTHWVNCVAVSADGTRIVSGSGDGTVRVWDAHTGSAVGQPLEGHTDTVNCVAVSADGARIVSGSYDKTVRVWDAHTGSAVGQPLEGHTPWVRCVAVSADGTRIVSQDAVMRRLWAMNAGGGECVLTSRDAAWQRTTDALELTWSVGAFPLLKREVSVFAGDGSEIVLGSCEQEVFNFNDGDVYFTNDMRKCRIVR